MSHSSLLKPCAHYTPTSNMGRWAHWEEVNIQCPYSMSIVKGQMCLITKQCGAYEYEYTWIVDNRSQSIGLHFGLGHDRTRALFTFRPAFHMTSHPRSTLWTNSFAVGRRFCERIDLRPAHRPCDFCNNHINHLSVVDALHDAVTFCVFNSSLGVAAF